MSKKNKKYKKAQKTLPPKSTDTKSGAPLPFTPASKTSSSPLIVFDKRTNIFLLILLVLYVGMSSLKLHTSSIANWDKVVKTETNGLIAGTPRFIRMDEWMVTTPPLIGQYELGMPLSNPNIGAGNTPLIWGMPVKDFTMLLRPNLWPYFIFDAEHAFAFSWNFNIFIFLISTFLFLMLLTQNKFWLAVFGTVFIFFSSGIQWWSYMIAGYMIYTNGAFISFIYILYSKNLRSLIVAGIVLILSIYGYIGCLVYPPFQVPLAYLYFFVLVGYLISKKDFKAIREKLLWRAITLAVVVAVLGIFLFHYYSIAKESYAMMMNTVYPGKRFSAGGDLIKGKFFSEFFNWYMTDTHTPALWLNICEESGFFIFFPILFYCMIYNYLKEKKLDNVQLSLSVYIIITILYILFGFPVFLSKLTLFSTSQACRVLPIMELGNCFLLICFLATNERVKKMKFSWIEFLALLIAIIIFIRLVSSNINNATKNFFSGDEVMVVTVIVTIIYLLIRYSSFKFITPALCVFLLGFNMNNVSVHPLMSGLSSLFDNPLVKQSKEIYQKDPGAKWVVFGNYRFANILKTNGINVFNGVKIIPNLKEMHVIDSSGKYDTAYNRYAHINVFMLIDWKDSFYISQPFPDAYALNIDPCSPKWKKLDVKYFVFTYRPEEVETRCMTKITEGPSYFIYKRNDE